MAQYVKNSGVIPLSFLLGFFHDAMYSRWKDLWYTLWWPDGLSMALIAAFPQNNEEHKRKLYFQNITSTFLLSIYF